MIKAPTVFVLGAGASKPYGFPLGQQLLDTVANELKRGTNGAFEVSMRALGHDGQLVKEFGQCLAVCGRSSIDAFLETRREFLAVGKAAIARALLVYEGDQHLSGGGQDAWYGYLFDKILMGSPEDFQRNKLTVITFNFDRSFERALFLSLRTNFNLDDARCAELAKTIPVLHVHGQLGTPSWLLDDSSDARPYGFSDRPRMEDDDIRVSARQIRIVHEEISGDVLGDAHEALNAAKVVCFLGFGYHETNLERLQVHKLMGKTVRGTTFGMPNGEIGKAKGGFLNVLLLDSHLDTLQFLRETDVIHG